MIYGSVVPFEFSEVSSAAASFIPFTDRTELFQERLKESFGREAVALDSGLAAIRLFLRAGGLIPGDEVAVPAYLCERVGRGLISEGYSLRYIDVGDDYNLSVEDFKKKISAKTRAVLAVHSYGIPCRIDDIVEIAGHYGTAVIDDSAQSFGGRYKGKLLGTFGDCGVLSFGWIKPLTAMGGGALLTENRDILQRAKRILKKTGTVKSGLLKACKGAFYLNKPLFYKFAVGFYSNGAAAGQQDKKTTERCEFIASDFHGVQAAMALKQMEKIEAFNRKRAENAVYLAAALSSLPVELPAFPEGTPLLRLPVRFASLPVEKVRQIPGRYLSMGIEAPALYPSLPDLFGDKDRCPNASRLASLTVNLPVHPCLSRDGLERIVSATRKICGK